MENPEYLNKEQVRNNLYKNLDYYVTESSGHNSEYNQWFRKRDDLIEKLDGMLTLVDFISERSPKIIAEYKESDIQVIDGNYGPYIKHAGGNYKIPKGTDPATLTEDKCKEIIAASEPTGRKKRRK